VKITEVIHARGHRNIRSTHNTTLEITKETELTRRGDCIIAIGATKGASDLNASFKQAAGRDDVRIRITIEAGEAKEVVSAVGSHRLLFDHSTDLVVRKSEYVCGRTIAIGADKAAKDLSRNLVKKLQDPHQKILITLTAQTTNEL